MSWRNNNFNYAQHGNNTGQFAGATLSNVNITSNGQSVYVDGQGNAHSNGVNHGQFNGAMLGGMGSGSTYTDNSR